MNRDIPVLFNDAMVRAIFEDRKTNTIRPMNPQPEPGKYGNGDAIQHVTGQLGEDPYCVWKRSQKDQHAIPMTVDCLYQLMPHCPLGVPGDRLWVQESYRITGYDVTDFTETTVWGRYLADDSMFGETPLSESESTKFLARKNKTGGFPGRFMYRSLSRITLEVTATKVMRVQDISAEEAKAEGIRELTKDGTIYKYAVYDHADYSSTPWAEMPHCPIKAFKNLWDSIYKERGLGWDVNPWVWSASFKRISDE